MDYKLAKQLRDAGFPQKGTWAYVINPNDKSRKPNLMTINMSHDNDGYANLVSAGYEVATAPTLSELIEACGSDFLSLNNGSRYHSDVWYAHGGFHSEAMPAKYDTKGKTPEEAVAKLWLKLNQKN